MNKIRPHLARITAVIIILAFYGLSRLPQLPNSERAALAATFGFTGTPLIEPAGYEYSSVVRNVHPELAHIGGWISAMGAAVGLNDLDGDGLANDLCHVDVRIDQVIISPVPGTPERYEPFTLDHSKVRYDEITMAPIGCLPNDMNEDGQMDILVYYWGRTPIAFLNNAGSNLSAASYTPAEIMPGEEVWWSSAATFADFDGDGHADLVITNYFPENTILLGSGTGSLINMNRSLSRAYNGGDTYILLWEDTINKPEATVKFRPVTDVFDEDVARSFALAVGAADLDGDLLPEIYFANDFGPDRLLHNRSQPGELSFAVLEGEKFFTTPNSKVLGQDSFKGMGVDFGDVNNDGLFDIYVSNIAANYALHESHFMFLSTGEIERMQDGIAPYVDYSEPLGVSRNSWGWETRLADFNNDGALEAIQATGFLKGEIDRWPEIQELALGNDELTEYPASWPRFEAGDDINGHAHNPFYVRAETGRFFDLAPELGLDQPHVTRGIATSDVDGDGDLDFVIANQWETSYFYRNDCPDCASFLGLHVLLPPQDNETTTDVIRPGHPGSDTVGRPAIGAIAKLHLPDGQQRVSMVDGGNGQAGARSSDIHFGLGQIDPDTPLSVELHWRDTAGHINQKTVELTPGWHTILLGDDRIVSR